MKTDEAACACLRECVSAHVCAYVCVCALNLIFPKRERKPTFFSAVSVFAHVPWYVPRNDVVGWTARLANRTRNAGKLVT